MAINFFEEKCTSSTNEEEFGIYDVPPAILSFTDSDNWHVWVDNQKRLLVKFVAIDNCLNIPNSEGERCEGMITYNSAIVFIELKDRDGGRWAGKSRDQLINSINLFKRDSEMAPFKRFYGHIANKKRPNFKAGNKTFYQEFEDKTGFILRVSNIIKIE